MDVITFHATEVPNAFRQKTFLRKWLNMVVKKEGAAIAEVSFVLLCDEALLAYNKQYLQHDDFTDVITFDLSEEDDDDLRGEILISYDRVRENAKMFQVSAQQELRRVMVHGLLHLCGHTDKTKALKDGMRALEDRYLALYGR